MRHGNSGKQISRNASHRKAMYQNMMVSLFKHEMIVTTLTKAKELRRFAEPIITRAKEDNLHNRRLSYDRLRDRDTVTKLFADIGPFYQGRPGGYLRVLKYGFRKGDNAPLAIVELVGRRDQESAA